MITQIGIKTPGKSQKDRMMCARASAEYILVRTFGVIDTHLRTGKEPAQRRGNRGGQRDAGKSPSMDSGTRWTGARIYVREQNIRRRW